MEQNKTRCEAVAGRRLPPRGMTFLGQFDPGIRRWGIAVLLVVMCSAPAAGGQCHSEKCSREFERTRQATGWVETASPAYCLSLQRFTECLRKTELACRGNLYFHTNLLILERKSERLNCSRVMAEAGDQEPVLPPPEYDQHPEEEDPALRQDTVCSYHGGPEMAFCGLFGDPHVRTFWGEYQTCRALGAWPLIDNAYLAVQVTNAPAARNEKATAPSKITVVVKQSEPCTAQLTYEAQSDYLPSTFVDGSVTSGSQSAHSVIVTTREPDKEVRITMRHINAVVVIRRVGEHLTFAVRLPRSIAEQSATRSSGLQLCAKGCPARERIDYRHVLSEGRSVKTWHGGRAALLQRDTIERMCRQMQVTDYYLDACVFDVLFTGRTSFMTAASEAQKDVRELLPEAVATFPNRTWLDLRQNGRGGNGGAAATCALRTAALALAVLFLGR